MRKILEEFAKGNITPQTRNFKKNSEYAVIFKKLCDIEEDFLKLLDENQKKAFDEFNNAQGKLDYLSELNQFIYGYKLGVLMTTEIFNGEEVIKTFGGDRV